MKFNQLFKGFLVGLIAPIVAFVVYVEFYLAMEVEQVFSTVLEVGKLPHVMSLSLLINLLIFFMKLKTNREQSARGVLFSTILYGIGIVILKSI